jgi:hypothetical protein
MQVNAVGHTLMQVLQAAHLGSAGEKELGCYYLYRISKGRSQEGVYRVVKDSANEIKLPKPFRDLSVKKAMRR